MATPDLQPLVAAVDSFAQAVKAAYQRARKFVGLTDNAFTLAGKNGAAVISDGGATFRNHIANKNNPHGVTADEVSAYSTATMDALIQDLMPSGILPIAVLGIGQPATRNFATLSGGWQFQIATSQALMAGRRFTVPTKAFNLSEQLPVLADRQNRFFYLYLVLSEGAASYQFSAVRLSESLSRLYVGIMQTNATAVIAITVMPRQRLDLYSISSTPAGMSIPSTVGLPSTLGTTLAAGWKN